MMPNLGETYKLLRELDELPQGRQFVAEDMRRQRQVSLLVFGHSFLSETAQIAAFERAVDRVQGAPHPTLRKIYDLECRGDSMFLVQEYLHGPVLMEILRKRGVLGAAEVAKLLIHLAPLADHAQRNCLPLVEMTLGGIRLIDPEADNRETRSPLLQLPVDAWEQLEVKVNGINLSLTGVSLSNSRDAVTVVTNVDDEDHGSSYVRLLSLLAYELLGGPRAKVANAGRFTPLAALSEDGNAVLRRGIADDFSSAVDMAEELIGVISAEENRLQAATTAFPPVTAAPSRTAASEWKRSKPVTGAAHRKPPFRCCDGRLMILVGLLALAGVLLFVSYRLIDPITPLNTALKAIRIEQSSGTLLPAQSRPLAPVARLSAALGGPRQLAVPSAGKVAQRAQAASNVEPTPTNQPGPSPGGLSMVERGLTSIAAPNEDESRGEEFARQYRWDLAIFSFSQAIRSDRQNAIAYSNLAFAYFAKNRYTATRLGSKGDALTALNEAVKLSPMTPLFLAQRAELYRSGHQYADALADLNRAIWLKPDLWSAFGTRGEIYWSLGRWRLAIADLNQAIEHNAPWPLPDWYPTDQCPLDPLINGRLLAMSKYYSMRASCYQMLGDTDAAKSDYAAFCSVDLRRH